MANKMQFSEVHMDANDVPEKFNKVAQTFQIKIANG